MAEQVERAPTGDEEQAAAKPAGTAWWRRAAARCRILFDYRVLGFLLAMSLAWNASMLVYLRLSRPAAATQAVSPEFELGSFEFESPDPARAPIRGAKFSLYISLLDGVDRKAREQLFSSRHRVQESVEELLRSAHGADFEDPDLSGLKRQVQEQLNGVLGMRAIADVIITDLRLQRGQSAAGSQTQTAGSASPAPTPSS